MRPGLSPKVGYIRVKFSLICRVAPSLVDPAKSPHTRPPIAHIRLPLTLSDRSGTRGPFPTTHLHLWSHAFFEVQPNTHRGYWHKTGVVFATNADYVCPSYIGSRGNNLENKPQTYGRHKCLWAVWLLGETVAYVGCLVVCRAAPGRGTPT